MAGWLSNFLEPEGTPQFPRNAGWLAQLLSGGGYQPAMAPKATGIPGAEMDEQQAAAMGLPGIAEAMGMKFPVGGVQPGPGMFAPGGPGMPMLPPGIAGGSGPVPEPPQVATGDPTVTSLNGGGPIPLPRPDPRKAMEASSRNVATQQPGAPLSLGPPGPVPDSPPPRGGGYSPPAGGGLPSLPFNPSTLLALASGFAGAPSFGAGMRRAFGNAAPLLAQSEAQDRTLQQKMKEQEISQKAIFQSFIDKGASRADAIAAVRDPAIRKEMADKYFGKESGAPAGYQKQADGTLKFIPGGPADPATKRALGDRQNAPPGYRWVDPNDESKGLVAIPGGPAEKITPEVSSRIGMADSFLGQLPEIRKTLREGGGTGPWDAFMAKIGQGRAGEVKRQIDSGAEALLRNLTGAGMSQSEASDYAGRYKLQPWDTVDSIMSKMNQLERELQFVKATVTRGRSTVPSVVDGKLVIDGAGASGKTRGGVNWSVEQ